MDVDRTMIGRTLAILEFCLAQPAPVPLTRIVQSTGLPKATVWRIAEALNRRGLLQRTADGYSGGAGLVELGNRAAVQTALRSVVTPALVDVHRQTDAAVWVVNVSSESDWTLVDSVYSQIAASSRYAEDWQHSPSDPAVLASALGILALANKPEGVAESLFKRGVPRLTPHTEIDPNRLTRAMDRAREDHIVVEHGRFRLGWSCIAVPILDPGTSNVTAVLGIVDRTPRFDTRRFSRVAVAAADHLVRQWPSTRS